MSKLEWYLSEVECTLPKVDCESPILNGIKMQ